MASSNFSSRGEQKVKGIVPVENPLKKRGNQTGARSPAPPPLNGDLFLTATGNSVAGITRDFFLNWPALSKADYRELYRYEFVIYKVDNTKASAQNINNAKYTILKKFTLPINPQNIQITVPFAVQTTVTQQGIVEEHNSAPIRIITISGTTGVLPVQALGQVPQNTNNVLQYIFRNTIQQIRGLEREAKRTINTIFGSPTRYSGPLNYQKINDVPDTTGYNFLHTMVRFFDTYQAYKKTREGSSWRLALHMHKDKMYYDVTLKEYSIIKSAGTLEYNYTIRLEAWRRHAEPIGNESPSPISIKPDKAANMNILARIINSITRARRVVARAYGVLRGIRADINDTLITPLNEAVLLMKDMLNLPLVALDFVTNSKTSFWAEMRSAYKNAFYDAVYGTKATLDKYKDIFNRIFDREGSQNSRYVESMNQLLLQNPGYDSTVSSIQGGEQSDLITDMFNDAMNFSEFFENVEINDLPLSDVGLNQINEYVSQIQQIDADGLRRRRDLISSYAASISEALGGGHETYNRLKGLGPLKKVYRKLSVEDISLLSALNDIIMGIDTLINILDDIGTELPEDYYSFYERYAISQGLLFNSNASKFLIPFPVGATLESLAAQYLGNPDRWIEIAALNGLKAPYIDEEGVKIYLTGSGAGNSFTIPTSDNLYVGQIIFIQSDTQPAAPRRIRSIDILSSIETLVEVDGPPTIGLYKVSDKAFIKVFRPNTVNSSMLIAIPSDIPTLIDGRIKVGVDIDDLNGLAHISKTDFLLDNNGDIVFGKDDVKLSKGLTNLIQAAVLKVRTRLGFMIQHPDYGNPIDVGIPISEIDLNDAISQLSQLFSADPRFRGVSAAELKQVGGAIEIKLLIGVANTDINLPISVQLPGLLEKIA